MTTPDTSPIAVQKSIGVYLTPVFKSQLSNKTIKFNKKMFISKKELNDLKCKAGQVPGLQAEITKVKNQPLAQLTQFTAEFNAHKYKTGQEIAALKKELDFDSGISFWSRSFRQMIGLDPVELPKRTLKTVLEEIADRLDHQEKMQKMLFAHLGIEYAKITEETKDGKQEKEVLRKLKDKRNERTNE